MTEHAADKALVAITLDLEMSRHFPTWDQMHWDYTKGNLDNDSKQYSVEAARRVKAHGGRLHFFVLGRVFEQRKVDWLEEIVAAGHPVGNHTYDHVNVKATKPDQIQFRFQRAPWLIHGRKPAEVIADNIRMTTMAMKDRLGIDPAGFRTPGGFHPGLTDRPDIQKMLLDLGFDWISSKYPPHANNEKPGVPPTRAVLDSIVKAQADAQPFVYESGLVEVPMSPISDVGACRSNRWPLESFLQSIREALEWTIEHKAVFDFLGHPSCLNVVDPEFRAVELICKTVNNSGDRAAIVDLATIAKRAKTTTAPS